MKKVVFVLLIFSMVFSLFGCFSGPFIQMYFDENDVESVEIYKDTPVYELAKAVNANNAFKIKKILKESPDIADTKDPKFGTPLVVWAVGMEKYSACKALLECGADPNVISDYVGGTALYLASQFSWIDFQAKKDARFVKLLLKYGADPNTRFVGTEYENITQIGTTPLMNAIMGVISFEKVKALVEGGADINVTIGDTNKNAAVFAVQTVSNTYSQTQIECAHYLIVEKNSFVPSEYYGYNIEGKKVTHYITEDLRRWIPELDSKAYKLKMEVVEELKNRGIDYHSSEIPQEIITIVQKIYPENWQEYLEKY